MPKFIVCFFIFDVTVVLLYLVDWGLGHPFWKFTLWVDLDSEQNIPAWYSSMQLFLVACFWAVFTYGKFDKKDKVSFVLPVLTLVFVVLSMDEIIGIHEWAVFKGAVWMSTGKLAGGTIKDGVLMASEDEPLNLFLLANLGIFLLAIPFLLFMTGLVFGIRRYVNGNPRVIRKYLAGVIMLALSAVGFDIITGFVPATDVTFVLALCCEELGEMAGVTFILWGTYELLLSHNFSLKRAFHDNVP